MSILLTILKIIGIILLVLLAVAIIFLVLLFLYRFAIGCREASQKENRQETQNCVTYFRCCEFPFLMNLIKRPV